MSRTVILFGTESGNAELVADDLADALEGDVVVEDMSTFAPADLTAEDFYIVVCSTHGDGDLPQGAQPFYDALDAEKPDLAGVEYAVFGLGDSSYKTHSRGSEIISEKLTSLGARRVGAYGRHDSADGSAPNDAAFEWLENLDTSIIEG